MEEPRDADNDQRHDAPVDDRKDGSDIQAEDRVIERHVTNVLEGSQVVFHRLRRRT